MEWLRDDLKTFLRDIDSPLITESPDERPEYINQAGGYIKISPVPDHTTGLRNDRSSQHFRSIKGNHHR